MKQYKNAIDQMISFKPFQDGRLRKKWFVGRYVDGEFYETYSKSFKTEESCQKDCDWYFNLWSKQ